MMDSNRFDFSKIADKKAWAKSIADAVVEKHGDADRYTTAAGISPSGVVHFGNFRDVVTAHLVRNALIEKGKTARLIFSWDNFDRFRKVPAGVPESFEEHIGKPLSKIPDPVGDCHTSYAEHFQEPFIQAMKLLDIEIEYKNQTEFHESGIYDDAIFDALKNREAIADILLSFMTEKAKGAKGIDPKTYKENYYPISVYSRFTGKDSTKILNYDGATSITYLCAETKKEETVDLREVHIAKLAWKPDWAMRWRHEEVHFEPGGHDHASPGGSYDTASVIAKQIFEYEPPLFAEYKFVGIQGLGAKMSGSKGNAVSPLELLDIYEPEVLRWLYFRKSPDQSFELAFNTEIYRQYDEYDAEHPEKKAIPFRQAVGFGQIVQWQEDKLQTILDALGYEYVAESITTRLPLARNWLETYNKDEIIALNSSINKEYVSTMDAEHKELVVKLRTALSEIPEATISELETLVYGIPKHPSLEESELKKSQRRFFKDIYNLLIGKDTGPRLGTFLWAVDRKKVLGLLDI